MTDRIPPQPDGPSRPRTIAVLTSGRQDWGILRSTCLALRESTDLRLRLIVGGMHLATRFGRTVDEIREDGFDPDAELDWMGDGSGASTGRTPSATDQAAGALAAVGDDLARSQPDGLVLVGDRLETMSAAVAATLTGVPVVHLHGGELTLGAFDDALRHAITKLSHLHLVSRPEYGARVVAMGEDPSTVHVVGAPGLDNAFRTDLPDRATLERDLGLSLVPPVVLVAVHPATRGNDAARLAESVGAAMDGVEATWIVTLPNSDPDADVIRDRLVRSVDAAPRRADGSPAALALPALGASRYWGLLRVADAMLGNSSSGLIEAPAVDLPAVNLGDRQAGRHREVNVIDVPPDPDAVVAALRRAIDPATRARISAARPDLADGHVGERIARIIAAWNPSRPPRKAPLMVKDE